MNIRIVAKNAGIMAIRIGQKLLFILSIGSMNQPRFGNVVLNENINKSNPFSIY
jgi:hypothetical protein